MLRLVRFRVAAHAALVSAVGMAGSGCLHTKEVILPVAAPHELQKAKQLPYTIEPPDILQVDLISAVPRPPYRIRPLDAISVNVANTLPEAPIAGPVAVGPDGIVDLGFNYGTATVGGLTLDEARAEIERVLLKSLKEPSAVVTLVQASATQQVRGPRLVRGDGTIGLGIYGDVSVVGLNLAEARMAIEARLSQFFQNPEVSVDVVGYNSKVFYVVFDYGGAGQQILRLPSTGSETVLDAIGQTPGLPTTADFSQIWVSRPGGEDCPPQVMPVDWKAVVEVGDSRTNYQVMPGDRIFVGAYPLVRADVTLARIIAPIERVFGVVLLGTTTVNTIRIDPNQFGGGGFVR